MADKDEMDIDPKASESDKTKKTPKKSTYNKSIAKARKKFNSSLLDKHLVLRPKLSKHDTEEKPPLVKQTAKYKKIIDEAKKEYKKKRREKSKEIAELAFKRAEEYEKIYKEQKEKLIKLKNEALLAKGFYVPPQPRLGFAIRIKGVHAVHPKVKLTKLN